MLCVMRDESCSHFQGAHYCEVRMYRKPQTLASDTNTDHMDTRSLSQSLVYWWILFWTWRPRSAYTILTFWFVFNNFSTWWSFLDDYEHHCLHYLYCGVIFLHKHIKRFHTEVCIQFVLLASPPCASSLVYGVLLTFDTKHKADNSCTYLCVVVTPAKQVKVYAKHTHAHKYTLTHTHSYIFPPHHPSRCHSKFRPAEYGW